MMVPLVLVTETVDPLHICVAVVGSNSSDSKFSRGDSGEVNGQDVEEFDCANPTIVKSTAKMYFMKSPLSTYFPHY
jgi:hypothetical protein